MNEQDSKWSTPESADDLKQIEPSEIGKSAMFLNALESVEAEPNQEQADELERAEKRVVDRYAERAEVSDGAMAALDTLHAAGYEAYLVGGFVRDALLGYQPKDEDITTNALPEETIQLFEANGQKVIPSGIEFGTVTVLTDDEQEGYEITTYRSDGESLDQRHPGKVTFVSSLKEDMMRRDFTINALAFDPSAEGEDRIIDFFGGVADLEDGLIRAVGSPEQRISEDALRMMRAVRFAAQKNMNIDQALTAAIRDHAPEIQKVSGERIGGEISKILLSGQPEHGINLLQELKLMEQIAPEFAVAYQTEQNNPWHLWNVGKHTEVALSHTPRDLETRAAIWLHDVGKAFTKTVDENGIDRFYKHADKSVELAKTILERLKFTRKSIDDICELVKLHDIDLDASEEGVCRFIEKNPGLSQKQFDKLIAVKRADNLAQNPEKTAARLQTIEKFNQLYQQFVKERPYKLEHLAMDGRDVMAVNQTRRGDTVQLKGKAIGIALQMMLSYCLRHPEANNKEDLTDFLRGKLKEIKYLADNSRR